MTEIKRPTISIIVAALKPSLGIGYQGKMPWRLRKEIKYFKDVTCKTTNPNLRNAVVMGRKTWESIPNKFRPLPNRLNVILSRSFNNEIINENLIHANSFENSLKLIKDVERIFIMGGGELYNELIGNELIDNLLITEINHLNSNEQIPMDTFLKFNLYGNDSTWLKQSKDKLQEFIGIDIELPDDDIVEGDFSYNYTLWRRRRRD
ncbi:DFR1 [[Candida] subhashii]|uniref:dihydrofolate reductase n=1 Tax=[Candida] subhashii TaxID=561895 RepID=A0A8J5UI44_9ASCO|nr:DFR1 [[Candida] subhashii]KAG7661202.1 DFR1 [[Candida] subhashii]